MIKNASSMVVISYYFSAAVALFSLSSFSQVDAFSFTIPIMQQSFSRRELSLSGLLDDVMAEKESSPSSIAEVTTNNNNQQQKYEDLMYSLVFSSNTAKDIEKQLEKTTDPKFCEYLSIKVTNSQDEEERQGLEELIELIETVKANVLQKEADDAAATAAALQTQKDLEKEAEIDSSDDSPTEKLSDADVLKQANAIDQAVISAALSDDEKPSDFISDCREVVNLSGGFNNNGRMRVGGS